MVEDITGVGLTTGGTTEEKRHLTVGNGLLGQIVVDDERVLSIITEPLPDGRVKQVSQGTVLKAKARDLPPVKGAMY